MPAPATASGMSITLPGNITTTDIFSFSVSTSGPSAIDVTPLTLAAGNERVYVESPIGNTFEASVSYFGSGSPEVGDVGNVTIGNISFYGVCTSASAGASVNDVARFDATFRQITP